MASENETVTEIVSEMRGSTEQRYCSSKHCSVKVFNPILDFADRIAAAHEREVKGFKNKCEEYERQPELMAETAKAALELLKAQESKIAELCECLNETTERLCQPCPYRHGKEKCADCDDVQKWRKALAEAAGESDAKTSCGCEGGVLT